MTARHQRNAMLIAALFLAGGGLALAGAAWVASPRLHVPPGIAYVLAGVLFVAALMGTLQVFGAWGWNDALAAVLLLGIVVEFLWLAAGSGPPRTCRWGWWQPPEPVCRAMYGAAALIFCAMFLWAIQRFRARRRAP
jgi:hypothetical protein